MAKAEIFSGGCGFVTKVEARMRGTKCSISIESDCRAIQSLAEKLEEVSPLQEISYKGSGSLTLKEGAEHCYHTSCPVPIGVIKVVEVEAGLALPKDVSIKFSESST